MMECLLLNMSMAWNQVLLLSLFQKSLSSGLIYYFYTDF